MLARLNGLDRLEDVCQEHLQLLKTMHQVGMNWTERLLLEDDSLIFRLGFHSVCRFPMFLLYIVCYHGNKALLY